MSGSLWYVAFPNHHQGLNLSRELKARGIKCTIVPTPRAVSACCGIALSVRGEDIDLIQAVIAQCGVTIEKIVEVPDQADWKYRSC